MKEWYAKAFSRLTNVSVRTLHHYDKAGLLKPSRRLANGYRLYSEEDLLKLQQITALKFFGFELGQIKLFLNRQADMLAHFVMQARFLQEKAQTLEKASAMLRQVTEECSHIKSFPWEKMIELIEVYQMTQQLEHGWVEEIFTPDELKQYADFEKEMKTKQPEGAFKAQWQRLVDELKAHAHKDPLSQTGIAFGKKYMDWLNGVYGKKYAHLRTKKWEKGFGEGKGLDEIGLTPELLAWVEVAINAYYKERIRTVLNQVGTLSAEAVSLQWDEIMTDMYGDDEALKKERLATIIDMALKDEDVSPQAKAWLQKM